MTMDNAESVIKTPTVWVRIHALWFRGRQWDSQVGRCRSQALLADSAGGIASGQLLNPVGEVGARVPATLLADYRRVQAPRRAGPSQREFPAAAGRPVVRPSPPGYVVSSRRASRAEPMAPVDRDNVDHTFDRVYSARQG
jgi:hypothetical protein